MRKIASLGLVSMSVLMAASAVASAAVSSITPLSTFGGGDGWRAPLEVLAGDTAGTATGSNYNYLGTGSLERGLAYNPVTKNLVLVSRSTAGGGIRLLDGATGVDKGQLLQGTGIISGGTFTTTTVGVGGDGQVYVGNLQTNATTALYRVYRWSTESQTAPVVAFSGSIAGFTGTPRLGDSMDVTGSGASTRLIASGTGTQGYAVITGIGSMTPAGVATAVGSFTPANPSVGAFRLGITFAQSANDVWGKQTSSPLTRSSYVGSAGTNIGTNNLISAGEMALDYTTIAGVPYLATVDANNSRVYVYDASDAANLVSLFPFGLAATTGTLASNGNGTGSVAWGDVDNTNLSATLYAMSTNQGVQAFTVVVPEPSMIGLAGLAVPALVRRRRA